ncbi:RNA methyltransferase tRNA(m5U54)methyltransferase [Ceratocystis pirilliformis]|uniref:tRNA (guanine(26)-N(2))-dimethyltransferase n=1 Tax=Ceratocystis pirilliformis TaxID=259994 RepID=A0ABR3ZJV4_9PEZI
MNSVSPDAPTYTYDDKVYTTIREGLADILVPVGAKIGDGGNKSNISVFYNPIQQFNRDLTVLAIRAYHEDTEERKESSAKPAKNKRKRKDTGAEVDSEKRSKVEGNADWESKKVESTSTETNAELSAQAAATQEVSNTTETHETETTTATIPIKSSEHEPRPRSTMSKFTILDALSASGLRALRYSHELPFVTSVTANDLSSSAIDYIKLNAEHNKLSDKIQVSRDDAIAHMYRRIADDLSKRDKHGNPSNNNRYNVIDLDPYGTASPFIDAAVQGVKDGGLLCVTCTDSAIWAGHSYCEKAFASYGGIPVKGFHTHEVGLRLILNTVATSAARYGLAIEPLLSLSIDYYTRIFIRVTKSQAAVKFNASKTMIVYNCDQGCGAWETQHIMRTRVMAAKSGKSHYYKHVMAQGPTSDILCRHCGTKMHLAGPMYGGMIQSPEFIQRVLNILPTLDGKVYGTAARIEGMLTTALSENLPEPDPEEALPQADKEAARIDAHPFYFIPSRLAGIFCCETPNEDLVRGALKHLGFRVTRSHCKPNSIKTDAPWTTIIWIFKEYIRQVAPVKMDNIKQNSPAWKLLNGGGELQQDNVVNDEEAALRKTLVFNEVLQKLGRDKEISTKKLVRYQVNPRENWGPMTRARK